MSKDQYTKEDELKDAIDNVELEGQDKDTEESKEEVAEKEPSVEELLQVEKDKYLRLFAEFENYKKRTSRERIELFKTASQE